VPPEQEKIIMENSYQANHQKAAQLLLNNQPVILAATYSRPLYHQMLKDLAVKTQSPLRIFFIRAPQHAIAPRLTERQSQKNLSNIKTASDYLGVQNRYQLIDGLTVTKIDTGRTLKQNLTQIFHSLANLQLPSNTLSRPSEVTNSPL
jgi:hypothetical protein